MTVSSVTALPVLPLRDIVVFPHMIVPLFVGREKSIKALEAVMAGDKQIILATQTDAGIEDPDMPPALLQPAWQIIHMAGGFKQALAFTGKAAHHRIGKPA